MNRAGLASFAALVASACGTPAPAKAPEAPPTPAKAAAPAPDSMARPSPAAAPQRSQQQQDLASDRSIAARTLGRFPTPITIYEVSDFQCPYCRDFVMSTLPALKREFIDAGKARIIFVNFPIPQLHPNALAAHEFAMCAADQSKFWPMHDLLYRHQDAWARLTDPKPYLYGLADSVHVSKVEFRACIMNGTVRELLQADVQASAQAGVHSTPSLIINGGLLAGAVPMKDLRPILDSIYRAATAAH